MKLLLTTLLSASLAAAAFAQTAPVGGPDAKGNAPIKHAHTINDGSAKPAANSFTHGQAVRHIEHTGYTGVTGLTKGKDGVWRGMAMKDGAPVSVAMDFKGNVSQSMGPAAESAPMASSNTMAPAPASSMTAASPATMHHAMHHLHRHHRHSIMDCNTTPGPNGVACSGKDRNHNGISDKEDRAIQAGAKP